jgi:hypothetical protein
MERIIEILNLEAVSFLYHLISYNYSNMANVQI